MHRRMALKAQMYYSASTYRVSEFNVPPGDEIKRNGH